MPIHRPRTLDDAVALRAAEPSALVVAGGTGVLPALTTGALDPPALLDLSRVEGFRAIDVRDRRVRLGAGVTYTDILEAPADADESAPAEPLADLLPALEEASRTVASRQIRNRATLAGALVLADPSGDALAALGAHDAVVEVRSVRGVRRVPVLDFVEGPGVAALAADELVTAIDVPLAIGPGAYAKAGARNAMARAVCGVAVTVHVVRRAVRVCVVGAAPRAVRPRAAEALAAERFDALDDERVLAQFAALVAASVDPGPDSRASAEYRRRAAGVLARRALLRAWSEGMAR